ncbi:MAG TPA: site-2 protease family protein [Thermomicrobiales bacterium]|nr:site-2 protease family protein [Thermomicrobiales bacterium]
MGSITRSPEQIIAFLLSFVIATTIHECAHAVTAYRLGDPTAKEQGRITLNPIMHFEPFGFFGMVLISLGYGFIGWGKPCPVNPSRFKYTFGGRRHVGMAIVALAGPVSNIAQALVVAVIYRFLIHSNVTLSDTAVTFINAFLIVNILLAAFNMIPIPPLDGHKILMGLLPAFWYPILAPLERYGFMLLFLLFFIGGSIGGSIVGGMIDPMRDSLTTLVNNILA